MIKLFGSLSLVLLICSLTGNAFGQEEEPFTTQRIFMEKRAPIFINAGVITRSFKPAELEPKQPGGEINFQRSAGIGVYLGLEMAINQTPDYDRMVTIELGFNRTQYDLVGNGKLNAQKFSLDHDINFNFQIPLSATEGAMKLNYTRRISKLYLLRFGTGFNIVQVPLNSREVNARVQVLKDGLSSSSVIFKNDQGSFPRFQNNSDQSLSMGFLCSAGIDLKLSDYSLLELQLRSSFSKSRELKTAVTSDFDYAGNLVCPKTYFAFSIGWTGTLNHRLVKK
ncbi:MAG: hypothetical protein GC181_11160 [Bacteroidetes bacterium]|nr:hypothetical protein [Bacteroidota bacterium]